ncbi:hypothetical protein HMPREF9389_0881 [Streptococcus sanguinis SK355]|uniref:Uncharacterized protein n=1 Tax=Streptococcus sanguinis SK355 TaxID=888816 RepID=F3UPP8_STRSA|nr:hypothetical protein HMPREF9389_0881 [Streptococcus sanguinis SK355]
MKRRFLKSDHSVCFIIKNKDLRQIENIVFYSLPKIKSKYRLNNAKSYVSTV